MSFFYILDQRATEGLRWLVLLGAGDILLTGRMRGMKFLRWLVTPLRGSRRVVDLNSGSSALHCYHLYRELI